VVDRDGVVRERFFEERYYHRMTMPSVLTRLGTLFEVGRVSVTREHVRVNATATQSAVHPGNRFTLFVEIVPADGVHVYGPDVGGGYQGLDVSIAPLPYLTAYAAAYPVARVLHLPWTTETLTGYQGSVRVAVDVALGTRQEMAAVLEAGQGLRIGGSVRLQACNNRECWAPETIPVEWHLDLIAPDLQRAPEHLQHKAKA
jgi:hypothetical protein